MKVSSVNRTRYRSKFSFMVIWVTRFGIAGFFCFIFAYIPHRFYPNSDLNKLLKMQEQLRAMVDINEKLKKANLVLKKENVLWPSVKFKELKAREQGFIYPGEIVYRFDLLEQKNTH